TPSSVAHNRRSGAAVVRRSGRKKLKCSAGSPARRKDMARTKRDRAGNPLRGDVAGDPSSAGGPVFSRDARQEARQVASEVLDAELAAESAVPRLFAASYDTHNRRLRFLSSSVPAAGGHLPAARPELLLYRAV